MRPLLVNIISVFWLSFLFVGVVQAGDYKTLELQIEQEYGIEIEFDDIKFHSLWSHINMEFTVVEEVMRKPTLIRLIEDLEKYRKNVIKKNLKVIYIPKTLSKNGVQMGGTIFPFKKWLYLIHDLYGDNGKYATGFHHEFSSILLHTHVFDWNQWGKLNPENFVYPMEDVPAEILLTEGNTDLVGSPEKYRQGFVCGYGSMDMENDMNTYFQLMIGNPIKLAKLEKKYPAIRKKAEVLRDFYYGVVTYPLQLSNTN